MTIQISNLDQHTTEMDVRRLFRPFGEVGLVQIDRDAHNNRSRGKGMVEMPVEKEARQAMLQLNGVQLGSKRIFLLGNNDAQQSRGSLL